MSNWQRVSREHPCRICGKSDWCSLSADGQVSLCRRIDSGEGIKKTDKAGNEYWVYGLKTGGRSFSSSNPARSRQAPPPRPEASPLSPEILHRAYSLLLQQLPLSGEDYSSLQRRGFTIAEIQKRGYKTLPHTGREAIVEKLIRSLGAETVCRLPGVFIKESGGRGVPTLAGSEGILIPVRNALAQIIALKIRRRGIEHPKYLYLSSASKGGMGPGSPAHVPLHHPGESTRVVRLTEGELKADAATAIGPILTISVAGVSSWRQAFPVLKQLGVQTCRIAFDMDVFENYHVARALRKTALELLMEGFQLEFELWDEAHKGIDDALRADAVRTVVTGGEGFKIIADIFKDARKAWRRENEPEP